jgi:hypothetical protein
MIRYTVQVGFATYYFHTETVEAETLDRALDKAIEKANETDTWSSTDVCGNTFVDAVAEGDDVDLWRGEIKQLPIPSRFTEKGEGPRVTVTVSGGVVQDIAIQGGTVRVEVRDYDVDEDDRNTMTDDKGDRYALADWSNVIPTAEAAE